MTIFETLWDVDSLNKRFSYLLIFFIGTTSLPFTYSSTVKKYPFERLHRINGKLNV